MSHAFLYSNGQMTDLGTLGGAFSFGLAINDAGQVTGAAYTVSGEEHGFVYSNGKMIDLGTLGGPNSVGLAINNAGQVTGGASTPSGLSYAFLYSNGQMVNLNDLIDPTLGVTLGDAFDINDNGQILANGGRLADEPPPCSCEPFVAHAFLLTPVPEPDTWALLGLPLLALLVGRAVLHRAGGRSPVKVRFKR